MAAKDNITSLEEKALERKERLKALKRKRSGQNEESLTEAEQQKLPKPKFRSYRPEDDILKENSLKEAAPGDIHSEVKDQLEAAKKGVVIDELDITNLAPRKPDWDLKRDVAKKLEKLEKRTQKAIAELIRDRLKEGQENLASVVNSGSEPEKR